jgi:four helix bundle protein
MELVLDVYQVTAKLPSSERFGLCSQMQRAGVSIPSNVAEGYERKGRGYLFHLRVSMGSLAELETQAEVALRLGFITASDVAALMSRAARVGQLLHGLRRSVRRGLLVDAARGVVLGVLMALLF